MKIVVGDWQSPQGINIAAYYTNKSGLRFWTVFTAMGFLNDEGELTGAAIFTDYTRSSIELHIIGDRLLTRANLKHIARYVFEQLSCNRLTVKLERKDEHLAKYLTRIGFEYEATLKAYYGLSEDRDALVYRIMRPQAEKWIK